MNKKIYNSFCEFTEKCRSVDNKCYRLTMDSKSPLYSFVQLFNLNLSWYLLFLSCCDGTISYKELKYINEIAYLPYNFEDAIQCARFVYQEKFQSKPHIAFDGILSNDRVDMAWEYIDLFRNIGKDFINCNIDEEYKQDTLKEMEKCLNTLISEVTKYEANQANKIEDTKPTKPNLKNAGNENYDEFGNDEFNDDEFDDDIV